MKLCILLDLLPGFFAKIVLLKRVMNHNSQALCFNKLSAAVKEPESMFPHQRFKDKTSQSEFPGRNSKVWSKFPSTNFQVSIKLHQVSKVPLVHSKNEGGKCFLRIPTPTDTHTDAHAATQAALSQQMHRSTCVHTRTHVHTYIQTDTHRCM